ncbi:hypothetical protein H5P28_18570 [Ruficoccus amylovorans]|uniref:Uncharacterized protein n=1 Tax=Ruficoccus amylovorans TaxID=1804625 RepID=A0A842HLD4_9BACT|nr:hypothetical protein [Ruficoccus amylovorans]MBC2596277.1 hypothetical protein [Ruficoccus amylovorans]
MPRHSSRRSSYQDDDYSDRRVRLRAKVFFDLQHLLPALGLVLLIAGIVQALFCYVPVDFANPLWEYKLFGCLIRCAWLPLIGLALILIPFSKVCSFRHLKLRGAVTWVALAAGIAAVLLVPYGIIVTLRAQEALTASIQSTLPTDFPAQLARALSAPRTGDPQEDLRLIRIALWGSTVQSCILSLLAATGFLLLFFKTGVYRYLLHQDAIGKGEHVGITRAAISEEDDPED